MGHLLKFLSVRQPIVYMCSGQCVVLQNSPQFFVQWSDNLRKKTTTTPPKTTTKAPTKTKQTHQNQNKAEKHNLQTSLATDNALQILLTDSCRTYLEKAGIGVSDFTIISACNRSV